MVYKVISICSLSIIHSSQLLSGAHYVLLLSPCRSHILIVPAVLKTSYRTCIYSRVTTSWIPISLVSTSCIL